MRHKYNPKSGPGSSAPDFRAIVEQVPSDKGAARIGPKNAASTYTETAAAVRQNVAVAGLIYLMHFHHPLKGRRHYIGFTRGDLSRRIRDHKRGRGAKLLRAANQAGIEYHVVRLWAGTGYFEQRLKSRKNAVRLCPICNERALLNPRFRLFEGEFGAGDAHDVQSGKHADQPQKARPSAIKSTGSGRPLANFVPVPAIPDMYTSHLNRSTPDLARSDKAAIDSPPEAEASDAPADPFTRPEPQTTAGVSSQDDREMSEDIGVQGAR